MECRSLVVCEVAAKVEVEKVRLAGGDFALTPIPRTGSVGFLNWQGLDKLGFQGHVRQALSEVFPGGDVPGTGALTPHVAASDVVWTDWKGILSGQKDPFAGGPTGRPDLQNRMVGLLGEISPKVAAIQEAYAGRYGWTVTATRIWERQGFGSGARGAQAPPLSGEFPTSQTLPLAADESPASFSPPGDEKGVVITDTLQREVAVALIRRLQCFRN